MIGTLVVGSGPGGVGALAWAARHDRLRRWAREGLLVVDASAELGAVGLGRYLLNADTSASSFLEGLDGDPLGRVREGKAARALESFGDAHPPLSLASTLLSDTGRALVAALPSYGGAAVARTRLVALRIRSDGTVQAQLSRAGSTTIVSARTVILAMGGKARAGGQLGSDAVLRMSGARLTRLVGSHRRVAIVGASHSAFSVAWRLLREHATVEVTIHHRRPVRVFYPSVDEALRDGYTDHGPSDVCPSTGRVHRLGGLRADGRELFRRVQRGDVARLTLVRGAPAGRELVIAATGYSPRMLPVFDDVGRLTLAADEGRAASDGSCRLALRDGALPQVFVIGMASGYLPSEVGDGERSFRGSTNGVWLYRHGTGQRVYEGVAAHLRL